MKALAEFGGRLAENPATFLIAVGVLVLVLGVSGGVSYNGWLLPIAAGLPQNIAIAAGAAMAFAGIVLLFKNPTSRRPYGITIKEPKPGIPVDERVTVEGKVSKYPPFQYRLWLLRMYQNGDIVPLTDVNNLTRGKEDWSVSNVHVGGFNNENRTIIALLAGPRAQYLLNYYRDAAGRHNRVIEDWKVDRNAKDIYLPTLKQDLMRVMDVIECDRVEVPVKAPPGSPSH